MIQNLSILRPRIESLVEYSEEQKKEKNKKKRKKRKEIQK